MSSSRFEPEPPPIGGHGASTPSRRLPVLSVVLAGITFLTTLATGVGFAEIPADTVAAIGSGNPWKVVDGIARLLATGLPYAGGIMAFFMAHEMGHYVACRLYRIPCTLPYFIPSPPLLFFGTFGAVIRIRGPIRDRRQLFDIGIAGPLAGFPVAVALIAWGLSRADAADGMDPEGALLLGDSLLTSLLSYWMHGAQSGELQVDGVYVAGWLGLLATAMNLFPAGQFDGGHIAYGIVPRWHGLIGRMSAVFLLALVSSRLVFYGDLSAWTLWALVLLFFGRRHPPVPRGRHALGAVRIVCALIAGAILVLCFMPDPIAMAD